MGLDVDEGDFKISPVGRECCEVFLRLTEVRLGFNADFNFQKHSVIESMKKLGYASKPPTQSVVLWEKAVPPA